MSTTIVTITTAGANMMARYTAPVRLAASRLTAPEIARRTTYSASLGPG